MKAAAKKQAEALTLQVTNDPRWELSDELMCQVYGFMMYGYVFGFGRLVCFMDVEEINALAVIQLCQLGIGEKYAHGMIDHAYRIFCSEDDRSIHSQLIGIGHSHFGSKDFSELVNAIFENTESIRRMRN